MGETYVETIVNGADVTYIEYFYDTLGAHSFSLNGTMYFYIKNLQGDVMQIATADNTIVASYTYDAWDNIESVTGTLADTVCTKSNKISCQQLQKYTL